MYGYAIFRDKRGMKESLSWWELRKAENGKKYHYLAERICDDTLQEKAFYNCKSLIKISLPSTLKIIGDSCFENSGLEEIEFNVGIKRIYDSAFHSCYKLEKVVLSSSVKTIGIKCFAFSGIKHIVLNEGLEEIGVESLSNCQNLETVKFPSTLTFIRASWVLYESSIKFPLSIEECDWEKIKENVLSQSNNLKKALFPTFEIDLNKKEAIKNDLNKITLKEIEDSLLFNDNVFSTYLKGYSTNIEFLCGSMGRLEFPTFLEALNNIGTTYDANKNELILPDVSKEEIKLYKKAGKIFNKSIAWIHYYRDILPNICKYTLKENDELTTACVVALLMKDNYEAIEKSVPSDIETKIGIEMFRILREKEEVPDSLYRYWLFEKAAEIATKCESVHAFFKNDCFWEVPEYEKIYDHFLFGNDYKGQLQNPHKTKSTRYLERFRKEDSQPQNLKENRICIC